MRAIYVGLLRDGFQPGHPVFVNTFATRVRNASKLALLEQQALEWHKLAGTYEVKKSTAEYRNALLREYEAREQQSAIDNSRAEIQAAQTEAAVRLARSYEDAKQMSDAVVWRQHSAALFHPESLLQLAEWWDKGTIVPRDVEKATTSWYQGYTERGVKLYNAQRYQEALVDLKKASESKKADASAFKRLGLARGKLAQWDDAIKAYTRSVELDQKSESATIVVLDLMEALICAERPEQVMQFAQSIAAKGWVPPSDGSLAPRHNALYHGIQAIALRMTGKDASDAERTMRQFTAKPEFAEMDHAWRWDELDQWLKTTKIAPDIKVQAERIIHELKGTPEVLFKLAERYEQGTGVAVDPRRASHYRYLGHRKARRAARRRATARRRCARPERSRPVRGSRCPRS